MTYKLHVKQAKELCLKMISYNVTEYTSLNLPVASRSATFFIKFRDFCSINARQWAATANLILPYSLIVDWRSISTITSPLFRRFRLDFVRGVGNADRNDGTPAAISHETRAGFKTAADGVPWPRANLQEHPDRNTALFKWLTTAARVYYALGAAITVNEQNTGQPALPKKRSKAAFFSPPSPLAAAKYSPP